MTQVIRKQLHNSLILIHHHKIEHYEVYYVKPAYRIYCPEL